MALWLDALPSTSLAVEVAPDRVAAARWSRTGSLDGYAVETLPAGALVPSAVETNIVNSAAVKVAVTNVCERLRAGSEEVALILPDTVIRVFVQHFEEFPRSAAEAEPMLRWKLKKSVPFEADETVISYMRQAPRESGLDIVTALARLRIIRESVPRSLLRLCAAVFYAATVARNSRHRAQTSRRKCCSKRFSRWLLIIRIPGRKLSDPSVSRGLGRA